MKTNEKSSCWTLTIINLLNTTSAFFSKWILNATYFQEDCLQLTHCKNCSNIYKYMNNNNNNGDNYIDNFAHALDSLFISLAYFVKMDISYVKMVKTALICWLNNSSVQSKQQ